MWNKHRSAFIALILTGLVLVLGSGAASGSYSPDGPNSKILKGATTQT